jgi:hypothetical protein
LLAEGVDYTADLANGQFTLTARPVGTVTADVRGAVYNSAFAQYTGDIVKAVIVDVFGAVESYLDTAALAAIDSAKPYATGIYIDDRANLLDVLDQLLSSVGAWYYWDNANARMAFGLVENPSGQTPGYYWASNNIARDGLRLEIAERPQYRTRLGYAKCWTVQSADQLAASVTDPSFGSPDDVAFVGTEYREAVYESASTLNAYPRSIDPQRFDTLIAYRADADAEAQARQAIMGSQVMFLTVSDIFGVLGILPGKFLNVTDDYFELDGGRTIQVLEVRKAILDGIAEVSGWFLGYNIFCLDYAALQADYSLDLGLSPCQGYFTSEGGLGTIL